MQLTHMQRHVSISERQIAEKYFSFICLCGMFRGEPQQPILIYRNYVYESLIFLKVNHKFFNHKHKPITKFNHKLIFFDSDLNAMKILTLFSATLFH